MWSTLHLWMVEFYTQAFYEGVPKPKLRRVICLIYHPCFGILRGWQFGRCPLVVHGVSTGLTWIRRLFFLFFISKQAASAQGIPCGTGSLVAVAPSESLREPCVGSLEIPGAFEPCCIRTTCAARCTRWLVLFVGCRISNR